MGQKQLRQAPRKRNEKNVPCLPLISVYFLSQNPGWHISKPGLASGVISGGNATRVENSRAASRTRAFDAPGVGTTLDAGSAWVCDIAVRLQANTTDKVGCPTTKVALVHSPWQLHCTAPTLLQICAE